MKPPNSVIIPRTITPNITRRLFGGKVIILYGPRRVGKTTIANEIRTSQNMPSIVLNCDRPDVRASLTNKNEGELIRYIGNYKLVVIDEAQRVENIGLTIKLLVDNYPDRQIIATGSSSFDLANKIKETLTGRAWEYMVYPFSYHELQSSLGDMKLADMFPSCVVTGTYPEVIFGNSPVDTISTIANNYLYKDALQFQSVKHSDTLEKLLQALALQVGSEVSYNELSNLLGIDKETVVRYIMLLEQAFVIFRLRPLSRNLRKELGKKHKIYFWDVGVRNALINQFNAVDLRSDIGSLWENFAIAQSIIHDRNMGVRYNYYFWRTYNGSEIDLIKEKDGVFHTFECKWSEKRTMNIPQSFASAYTKHTFAVLTPKTFPSLLRAEAERA